MLGGPALDAALPKSTCLPSEIFGAARSRQGRILCEARARTFINKLQSRAISKSGDKTSLAGESCTPEGRVSIK